MGFSITAEFNQFFSSSDCCFSPQHQLQDPFSVAVSCHCKQIRTQKKVNLYYINNESQNTCFLSLLPNSHACVCTHTLTQTQTHTHTHIVVSLFQCQEGQHTGKEGESWVRAAWVQFHLHPLLVVRLWVVYLIFPYLIFLIPGTP